MAEPYSSLPGLGHFYLEDSWVLGLDEAPGRVVFSVEFVLTEAHPEYRPPGPGDQYCYREGRLLFEAVTDVEWSRKSFEPIFGPNGEVDYGNIDGFVAYPGRYHLWGDWGDVTIHSEAVSAQLTST